MRFWVQIVWTLGTVSDLWHSEIYGRWLRQGLGSRLKTLDFQRPTRRQQQLHVSRHETPSPQ